MQSTARYAYPHLPFDRCWASTVLDQTVARSREEYAAVGRSAMFDELKHFQPGGNPVDPTRMTCGWIAARLRVGNRSHVSNLVYAWQRCNK